MSSININKLFKEFEKEKQNNYTKALETSLEELCSNFKRVFDKEEMMKSSDVYKWTEINFDKAHKVNVAAELLAIHGAIYKEHREQVFNFMVETVNPKKLKNAFYFNPNRNQLCVDKLKKQELVDFNIFKEAVEGSGIMVKDLVYSKFLSSYMYAFKNKSISTKDKKYVDIAIDNAFSVDKKLVEHKESKIQAVFDNFFSVLKYFAICPATSHYLLITLQGDETFPIFEEFYDELTKHGSVLSELIYCWADSRHMPINRFALYETHPKTIDFLISKGLPVSVYISSTKDVKIKTRKEDVIKGIFKSIKYDYDWQESDKDELKNLLDKQRLERAVPKVGTSLDTIKDIKL